MTSTDKRKPGRPPIPRQRIVDTALQIVDTDGAEALSLRALADRLSSSTATLYRHVDSRAELIGLVIDRMLADVDLPPADDDDAHSWDVVCHRTATAVFATIAEHRRVAPLLIERFPTGPHAIALRERMARALLRGGFSADVVATGVATLGRYVLGFAMQANSDQAASTAAYSFDERRHPSLIVVAEYLPTTLGDEFDFGLTHLLSGLEATQRAR
ncbi:TetR/AcrR family transcriptional regulator [Microbacterium aurugineum]